VGVSQKEGRKEAVITMIAAKNDGGLDQGDV
jgi:hypothetical protein